MASVTIGAFEIDVEVAPALATIEAVSADVDRRMQDAMATTLVYLQSQVMSRTPTNTGALRGSIVTRQWGTPVVRFGQVATPRFGQALAMEKGRRPGQRFPPREAIALWAQQKLGVGDQGTVWLIMRSIAMRGSPKRGRGGLWQPYHMFEEALKESIPHVKAFWKAQFSQRIG